MLNKIGHLGIAVKDIEQTLAAFTQVLGLPKPVIVDVAEKKMKVAVLELEGISLEFLQDYSDAGPLKKFIEQRGNAIHHFCMDTPDIDKEIEDLASRGIEMREPEPRVGLRGKKIDFIDPKELDGILVELSEP